MITLIVFCLWTIKITPLLQLITCLYNSTLFLAKYWLCKVHLSMLTMKYEQFKTCKIVFWRHTLIAGLASLIIYFNISLQSHNNLKHFCDILKPFNILVCVVSRVGSCAGADNMLNVKNIRSHWLKQILLAWLSQTRSIS